MGAFDDLIPGAAKPAAGAFEDLIPAAPTRSALDVIRDVGVTGLTGAVGLPQAVVGLVDIPTGGRVGKFLEENVGYRPGETQEMLAGLYSDAQRAANAKVQAADGFVDTLKTAVDNPSTIATTVGESLPQMLGGAAVARGITAVAPKVAPWIAGALGEGVLGAGAAASQIREQTDDGLLTPKQSLAAAASGAGTAAFGAAGGRLAQRLGIGDIDTMLASKAGGALPPGKTAAGFVKAVVGGGISEGAFEELPQSVQEQMLQNYALDRPLTEGVGNAAAMGLLSGAAMGGGAGGYSAAVSTMRQAREGAPAAATPAPAAGAPEAPAAPAAAAPSPQGVPLSADEVLGAVPRGSNEGAEALNAAPRTLTALDRVQEIDARLAAAPAGQDADLEPLRQERAELTRDWPATVPGAPASFSTETGARLEGQYALIEADDMVTSHDRFLRRNAAYPQDLQPRERERAASEMQISSISQRLDPARLGASADAATGAPIIGADGLVESGNARSIALSRVYAVDGEKAEEYRGWLRENAQQFGLSPDQVAGMSKPVLVRVRRTPVNRAEFARQANASTVAAMSPTEQARADAARLDTMDDLRPDDDGNFATSRSFISRFVGRLPATERGAMVDADGQLSSTGYARVRNAVLAKAYGESPVLAKMVESLQDDQRNVSRALLIAAPRVAQAREAIEAGRRHPADITPHLMAAVTELGRLREAGRSVDDALAQQDIGGEARTPEAATLMRFLAENARRPRRIADFLTAYHDGLDAAGDPGQASLLDDGQAPTVADLIEAAQRQVEPPPAPAAGPAAANDSPGTPAWRDFPAESGTLGIPRAKMPQVKMKVRPQLYAFLEGRGISSRSETVPPDSLKPTQAEFSPTKVQSARELTGDAAGVLVSSDGYVLDGHHRWLAKAANGEPVDVRRFDAPIDQLLDAVREFSGTTVSNESDVLREARAAEVEKFYAAAADLGDILTKHHRAAIVPEDTPDLMPVLVRLFESAIKIVGTDLKRATAWVKERLKADPATKKTWNRILPETYRKAALEAIERSGTDDLMGAGPAESTGNTIEIDGRTYDLDAPNFGMPAPPRTLDADDPLLGKTARKQSVIWKGREVPRVTMHSEIIDGHFEGAVPPQGRKPIAYVMGGGGASGKGTLLKQLIRDGRIDDKGVVHIDPDEIKQAIPEYREIVARGDSRAAATVHDESSDLARRVEKRAADGGFDVVLDVTLGDPMKGVARLQALKDAGYDVRLFGVTVDPRIAVVRALKRAETSFRYVPISSLLEAHKGFIAAFDQYAAVVDQAALIDNTYEFNRSEMAAKPAGGELTIRAPQRYNEVRERNGRIDERAETLRGIVGAASQSDRGGAQPAGARVDAGPLERDRGRDDRGARGASEARGGLDRVGARQGQVRRDGVDPAPQSSLFDDDNGQGPRSGPADEGARPARRPDGPGPAAPVAAREGRGDRPGGDGRDGQPAQPGALGQPGAGGERGGDAVAGRRVDQDGGAPADGAADRRRRGSPVAADIRLKSGLNWRYTDENIVARGSWFKRAAANVEAVELLKTLQKEGRKATADEQAVLARFVGWGASDIAQNLFAADLDERVRLRGQYDAAVAAFEKRGNRPMSLSVGRGFSYPEGWFEAASVLEAKRPKGVESWKWRQDLREITREQLDAAAPSKDAARWKDLRDRMRAVMTTEELAEARRTTQYGHYTAAPVVRGIWAAVQRLGFAGGHVLEPGAGTGLFPGLMPEGIAAASSYTGVEYDSITGGILAQLFPDENVIVDGYQNVTLPRGFYDLAVGNPPFADVSVLSDREYARHAFSLHDYFFAKTLDRVKPGGVLAFVTSNSTMDKKGDKARAYFAERADLVGAIRLPNTAHKANAGTEVVTDILFFRKKVDGETFEGAQPFQGLAEVQTPQGPTLINEYFAANPQMVLGRHGLTGSMYRSDSYTVEPIEGQDLGEAVMASVQLLPEGVFRPGRGTAAEAAAVREVDFNPAVKKEGSYYLSDAGVVMQREEGVGKRVTAPEAKLQVLAGYVPLRDALKQAQYDQLTDGDWETSLAALQQAYSAFTAKHGPINQSVLKSVRVKVPVLDEDGEPTNEKVWDVQEVRVYPTLAMLRDDPDYTLAQALEVVDEETGVVTPSDFLSKRVLGKAEPTRIDSPQDALLVVLNEVGRVDMAAIAARSGLSEEDAAAALGTSVFLNPDGQAWETADEYLSGNVRQKLKLAEKAAQADRRFERNVQALKAAQPQPKTPNQINVTLGQNWVPPEFYEQFIRETAGVRAAVRYNEATREWSVELDDRPVATRGGKKLKSHQTDRAQVEWGTEDRHAGKLLEHALTGRPIIIKRREGTGKDAKEVLDKVAVEAANAKLTALRDEFTRWVWTDAERTDRLVSLYNERFNTLQTRRFDGRHLTLPGSSKSFKVFDHVKRGAWRIVSSGNTYLAHAVGSGKTFQMVIAAMEMKRLGIKKKPMIVVPNHMLRQFSSEWQQLYPMARLAVADEEAFHLDNRRRWMARVALSDLDGVIITQSAFAKLDIDPAHKAKIIGEQLDYLRATLEEASQEDDGDRKSPRTKQIENRIEKLEERLKKANSDANKDGNVLFDQLGVDMLFVDEAHAYRKLDFGTARQVKGLSPEGSARAMDLYTKVRWLDERYPGRSLVMASGTPVVNTLAELYSLQRFMNPQGLADAGLEAFDDWAAQHGRESTALERNAGGEYAPVTRMAKFVNVSTLSAAFRRFADVVTADELARLLGDRRPKVKGGQRSVIVTPKTQGYVRAQRALAERFKASKEWKPTKDQPNNPDPVIAIIGDGRLAAIDERFVNPAAPNDPDSKLNVMIDAVIRAYRDSADNVYTDKAGKPEPQKGSTMMVFSDLGFGDAVARNRGFSARAWMEKRLRDAGVPKEHVAFIQDYPNSQDKLKLFKDVNAGRVRILAGSSTSMGTGVNAQQRLLHLFHLDAPWFPADLEQREGRIVRQGNKNKEVNIHAFATKGSYDEQMWATLARKQKFIDQVMAGDETLDEVEDLDGVSQMEIAAGLVADDPRVLQLAGIKTEIARLERLYQAHENTRQRYRDQFRSAEATAAANSALLPKAEKDAAKAQDLRGDAFKATVGTSGYVDRTKWGEAILQAARTRAQRVAPSEVIGSISGFDVRFVSTRSDAAYTWQVVLTASSPAVLADLDTSNPMAVSMGAQRAVSDVARGPALLREAISQAEMTMDAVRPKLDTPFQFLEMLANLRRQAADLEVEISTTQAGEPIDSLWGPMRDQAQDPDTPDVVFSRGGVGGIALDDLRAVATRVQRAMPGLPPVTVLQSPVQAPPALRDFIDRRGASSDAEGALFEGRIFLFASGIRDAARAEHVLAEHEAAHAGLRGLLGTRLKQQMQAVYNLNPRIRRQADDLRKLDTRMSLAEAVEEVLVDMPTASLVKLQGWRGLMEAIAVGLRKMGLERMADAIAQWVRGTLTNAQRADLMVADLVRAARAHVRRRKGDGAGAGGPMATGAVMSRASTAPAPAAPVAPTPASRAEALLATSASTPAPIDYLADQVTRVTGIKRLASMTYGLGARLIERLTPEKVKAGIVSDYGVPEAVIDRRALLQGAQREQMRQAGQILEKLATMTRAESRVAYEWMNMDGNDPQAYLSAMQGLPEESVLVLQQVQQMIDELSREAVRLGQLDEDTFKRHRFAYLRRSYFKHEAELTKGEAASRGRTISILGDQYKGRGMVAKAPMKQVQNVAPDWWQRKLKDGKADTALKGQKFRRLERRAPAGEGTMALQGVGQRQERQRLQEVHYWPADTALPARYADWNDAGTWEVRDTKGDDLVLWRDFTKDERERMGEIDEARFAIAKTLHRMIHDVEVGRYLEWLGKTYAKANPDDLDGPLVEASEKYRHVFKPGEWVEVPSTKIQGTDVEKYGRLAGKYLPGPIWNDLRQITNGRPQILGEHYDRILQMWKISKTALSPGVHTNNIMSNMVMADWAGVSAGHIAKALRIILAAREDRAGILASVGNAGRHLGIPDADAAREVMQRYELSGGSIGGWVTAELAKDQMKPLLEALQAEVAGAAAASIGAEVGIYAAFQHLLGRRFPQAWESLKASKPVRGIVREGETLIDLYQAEDDVFRLAAWLQQKEAGASDADAGKVARRAFLDYNVNAPWIAAARATAFPFIAFVYRAVPRLLDTMGNKPHKLLKLMALAGALNALGVALAGGGDDDERKLLPEEKAGRVWGIVPKLIRMPWNDAHGSPVYLDIRRWIPAGDIVDTGATNAAVPVIPAAIPGGPLALLIELISNKSQFTGKAITLETDTTGEKLGKVFDHVYKWAMPNIIGVPGTYATEGVAGSLKGRTDAFGREMSTPMAVSSAFGVKLGSYPADVLRQQLAARTAIQQAELDTQIRALRRQRMRNGIDEAEFREKVEALQDKKRKLNRDLADKLGAAATL